ncbi:MAG: excinuclease ABC subunit UvrB [Chloroflexi bacterium]|nr:excinuclease ABC subunit UvrB [Chloroflexota bacterium]
MPDFQLTAAYQPTGDQPQAIRELVGGINDDLRQQVLLGATGTGKTFTIANVIQQVQRPTLIFVHNKTLAAQLYSEFKQFFPHNAVSYYVSYYDYYQPEAYVPRTDTYIEKTTDINMEIEMMRLAATQALATRRDVIVVASVSAIYSLGDPIKYNQARVEFKVGQVKQRNKTLRHLIGIRYERNDLDFKIGSFRVRGDVLELRPSYTESAYRVEFWGDEVERITEIDPLTGELLAELSQLIIHPAKHFVTAEDDVEIAITSIKAELEDHLDELVAHNKLLEAQRLEQRTRYDIEMLRELGYCSGSENYTSHFYQRPSGAPPWTLLDYFPDDFLMVVDESHMTIPQIRAMYRGDRHRKQTLVDYGFRLPSALDNRPLTFEEWEDRIFQVIHTTATPGPYEQTLSQNTVQQIIRPTGLLDPEVTVRPSKGQVDDLLFEVKQRIDRGQRALITTLTKRMAEDLATYLQEMGLNVHYLHSEINTFERVEILQDLRAGVYDAVVGINLLREGLDLPEVSLVVILDADKEGFLRSETALIQTIGRAARHAAGQVIMYAGRVTNSMQRAIEETNRRRAIQQAYNENHNMTPQTIIKAQAEMLPREKNGEGNTAASATLSVGVAEPTPIYQPDDLLAHLDELEDDMQTAARNLEFEKAAKLRDKIVQFKRDLVTA